MRFGSPMLFAGLAALVVATGGAKAREEIPLVSGTYAQNMDWCQMMNRADPNGPDYKDKRAFINLTQDEINWNTSVGQITDVSIDRKTINLVVQLTTDGQTKAVALPLVRKSKKDPKPIKVYLQDGRDDLNNLHGNWPLGNQDLAAALQFAGYKYKLEMTDGGHSGKWGGERLPEALKWLWDDNAESTNIPIVETKPAWEPHPDAVAKEDVPKGTVEQMPVFESKIFAGTTRAWSIYVPAQYKADNPAALMVFQDGEGMKNPSGRWRVPTVFDNLIARGDMPPTIAVLAPTS